MFFFHPFFFVLRKRVLVVEGVKLTTMERMVIRGFSHCSNYLKQQMDTTMFPTMIIVNLM